MFALMGRYFEDIDRRVFESDLSEKDEVVLIHAGSRLGGFSTMHLREETLDDRKILVLFSGDTIIDAEFWGTPELQRCFVERATRAMRESDTPLYWLLICGGYRTYRYLPLFFREFWPHYQKPTPPDTQQLIDALARRRFGDSYQDGVVIGGNGLLREDVSPIDEKQLKNPHIAYFDQTNPDHVKGHELVCLAQVAPGNLTRVARKIQKGT